MTRATTFLERLVPAVLLPATCAGLAALAHQWADGALDGHDWGVAGAAFLASLAGLLTPFYHREVGDAANEMGGTARGGPEADARGALSTTGGLLDGSETDNR